MCETEIKAMDSVCILLKYPFSAKLYCNNIVINNYTIFFFFTLQILNKLLNTVAPFRAIMEKPIIAYARECPPLNLVMICFTTDKPVDLDWK